jgi:hypothetical protein
MVLCNYQFSSAQSMSKDTVLQNGWIERAEALIASKADLWIAFIMQGVYRKHCYFKEIY